MRHAAEYDGRTFWFDVRDEADVSVVHEVWGSNVYHVDHTQLAGRVVLDVGACFGAFTVLAMAHGAAGVVAVEPDPANLDALRGNVGSFGNPGGRVSIVGCAAGFDGTTELADGEHTTRSTREPLMSNGSIVSLSLDQLLAEADHRVGHPSLDVFVKVDCEGCEFDLFLDASPEAMRRVGRIAMEWHCDPPRDRLGPMIVRLLDTHAVEVFGVPGNCGGHLYAHRY